MRKFKVIYLEPVQDEINPQFNKGYDTNRQLNVSCKNDAEVQRLYEEHAGEEVEIKEINIDLSISLLTPFLEEAKINAKSSKDFDNNFREILARENISYSEAVKFLKEYVKFLKE